jgi:hypothetical protein
MRAGGGRRCKGAGSAAHRARAEADDEAPALAALQHALLVSVHQHHSVPLDTHAPNNYARRVGPEAAMPDGTIGCDDDRKCDSKEACAFLVLRDGPDLSKFSLGLGEAVGVVGHVIEGVFL